MYKISKLNVKLRRRCRHLIVDVGITGWSHTFWQKGSFLCNILFQKKTKRNERIWQERDINCREKVDETRQESSDCSAAVNGGIWMVSLTPWERCSFPVLYNPRIESKFRGDLNNPIKQM